MGKSKLASHGPPPTLYGQSGLNVGAFHRLWRRRWGHVLALFLRQYIVYEGSMQVPTKFLKHSSDFRAEKNLASPCRDVRREQHHGMQLIAGVPCRRRGQPERQISVQGWTSCIGCVFSIQLSSSSRAQQLLSTSHLRAPTTVRKLHWMLSAHMRALKHSPLALCATSLTWP
eukprot:1987107-Rhodomonas_salina.1